MPRLLIWALRALGSPAGWIALGLGVLALGKASGDATVSGLAGTAVSTFNVAAGTVFSALEGLNYTDGLVWSDLEKSTLAVVAVTALPFLFLQANGLRIWAAKLGVLGVLVLIFYLTGRMDLFSADITGDGRRLGPYILAGGYALFTLAVAVFSGRSSESGLLNAFPVRYGQNLLGAGILIGGLHFWDMANLTG
ncbi:MAG: hypothetical protein AAGA69_04035 [Pseudomonadota bacterium]